ncbi:YitT family protein, partial [Turicibacter sanguinis]|nr:YitT family protein [Turicibacter sanguinis]
MNFIKNEVLSVKIKNLSIMLIGNLLIVLAIN